MYWNISQLIYISALARDYQALWQVEYSQAVQMEYSQTGVQSDGLDTTSSQRLSQTIDSETTVINSFVLQMNFMWQYFEAI